MRKVRALGSHVAYATARPEFGEGKSYKNQEPENPIDNTGSDKNLYIYWVALSQGNTFTVSALFFWKLGNTLPVSALFFWRFQAIAALPSS